MNVELQTLLKELPQGVHEGSVQGFALVLVKQAWGELVIARQGAQVLHFQPAGARPLLWLSDCLKPAPEAIRGGIPVCWPWFAGHPDDASQPFHGLARTAPWDICVEISNAWGTTVKLRPSVPLETGLEPVVRVKADGQALEVSLETHNGTDEILELTQALHTYLAVSDLPQVTLEGLQGCEYRDKLQQGACGHQPGTLILNAALDRIYLHDSVTQVHDTVWRRRLSIAKSGSGSTVVWNPGAAADSMVDVGLKQQPGFVCVEAANTCLDPVRLLPGQRHCLSTTLSIME